MRQSGPQTRWLQNGGAVNFNPFLGAEHQDGFKNGANGIFNADHNLTSFKYY